MACGFKSPVNVRCFIHSRRIARNVHVCLRWKEIIPRPLDFQNITLHDNFGCGRTDNQLKQETVISWLKLILLNAVKLNRFWEILVRGATITICPKRAFSESKIQNTYLRPQKKGRAVWFCLVQFAFFQPMG